MKFFIKDFFSRCDQIRRKLPIWSHLHEQSLMKNFIFCALELNYYPFMISLDKCKGNCNLADDLSTKIFVPNKKKTKMLTYLK